MWFKLALAFLLATIAAVLLVALLVTRATETAFRSYVHTDEHSNISEWLTDYYQQNGSWEGVDSLIAGMNADDRPRSGAGPGQGGWRRRGPGQIPVALADRDGLIISATDQARTGKYLDSEEMEEAAAILVDGETAGWFLVSQPPDLPLSREQSDFLDHIHLSLAGAALVSIALSVGVGTLLARRITRPLGELTEAARAIAAGNLEQRVAVNGQDELAQLSRAFNQMAEELARNEELRRRMVADVAHELRTPLSVVRGHLEAILDGVFPADAEHIAPIHERTILLSRLVEDLRTLALAEAGQLQLHRQEIEPGQLVQQAVVDFTPLAQVDNIALQSEVAPNLPGVQADPVRLSQVFANLLSNALRHTRPGGRVVIRAEMSDRRAVLFSVSDSGPGLTAEEIKHIFDRFWRADESRARDRGGAGLGLAITRQLVEAHGGRIWAVSPVQGENGPEQGTAFCFSIPLCN